MGILGDKWNKNNFSVYTSEEKTILKTIENINKFVGDELVKEVEQKTDIMGNHLGAWQGLNKPTLSEEGMRATVEKINDIDIPNINNKIEKLVYYVSPTGTNDDTTMLQTAFDNHKHITLTSGIYFVNAVTSLKIKSNTTVEFLEGAKIQVITNSAESYRAVQFFGSKNITLINPYIVGDKDTHDFSTQGTHEYGHGIYISTGENIKIINPKVTHCTGDGISIYRSKNIRIENPITELCRRQGISIVGGEKIDIIGGYSKDIGGALPGAGIDIEPNSTSEKTKDINIIDYKTINCAGGGIMLILQENTGADNTDFVSINIENHKDEGSPIGFVVGAFCPTQQVNGFIRNKNASYINPKSQGIYIASYYKDNTPKLTIENPLIINPNTGNSPISFPQYTSGISMQHLNTSYGNGEFGNVEIINPIIIENRLTSQISNGIYIEGEKAKNHDVIISNPTIKGIPVKKMINTTDLETIKIYDNNFNNTLLCETQYNTIGKEYISLVTNIEMTTITQVDISKDLKHKNKITFINKNSNGMIIVPPSTHNILPLNDVKGKYITTTQKGASVTLTRLNDESYIIENLIGTWIKGE